VARFYGTTPIFYVNDAPHVGHAYTALNVDAVTRWHRLLGDEVFFLTGTDEHGLKIQRSAEEAGRTPIEQADLNSQRFRDAFAELNLANDDFIRTTEPRHHQAVQTLLQRAYDNGFIYESTYEGWYCVGCEAYYAEDELDENNACLIHHRPAEHMSEDNYFFKLSAFQEPLEQWFENEPENIRPSQYRSEAQGLLRQGLQDVSMTRTSIDWGISVPWDDKHVFYVWYDALINYATAVGYGTDDQRFADWWPATRHFMAKDILRFHTIYWPAMLMAAGVDVMPKYHIHGYLLLGGEKMSKSGNVTQVAPSEFIADFGVDGFRHALLRDHPFGPDSEFSYEGMMTRYNTDLANNYGNLVSRVATVVGKKCGGVGPAPRPDSSLAPIVAEAYADTAAAWERVAPSVALEATRRIVRETNEYLQSHEPWKMEPGAEVDAVMGDALEALRIATILAWPSIPDSAEAVWKRLGLDGTVAEQRLPEAATWGQYPGDVAVETGDPLFPRLKLS
jgi:methionyl-tRNA synthetase